MTIATINRILRMFSDAFQDLSIQAPMRDIERLAILVHHSMEHGRRKYHTSAHLFDMADGMNSRQTLALLFHDIVYFQLDDGFPEKAREFLTSAVEVRNNQVVLLSPAQNDVCVQLCADLFGFRGGDTLPLFGGMNEFLSAIVATRLLQPYLPVVDLLAIATCIEATVPFRGPCPDGQALYERTTGRVTAVNQSLHTGLDAAGIQRLVTDALLMANRDVGGFSLADPGLFLATTWQLIEESNAPLAAVGLYSVGEYRGALMRMEKFLASLNPDHVFHSYRGTPEAGAFAALQDATRKNLAFSVAYLGAKIVSIALIEALALETGGDCPVAMLLGDIRSPDGIPDRVENFLPPPDGAGQPTDPALFAIFENGRARESAHDLTVSPLTAYVYRYEGQAGTCRALEQARKMFSGELTPRQFLATLQPALVRAIAGACAHIAFSRSAALRELESSWT